MLEFSFIEYTYDPNISDPEEIQAGLNRLGFVHRSQHRSDKVGFWSQNQSIVLLRQDNTATMPKVSGLGFITAQGVIDSTPLTFDQQSNIYSTTAPNGLRILLVPENYADSIMAYHYDAVDRKAYSTPGLINFSGAVISQLDPDTYSYFTSFGFKKTKDTDRYTTLVSANRRFSVIFDKAGTHSNVTAMVTETQDIFHTTACFTVTNVGTKHFEINDEQLVFDHMNHKLKGYNCLPSGSAQSYCIENFVPNAFGDTDLIFRMRKNFLHINEKALKVYYDQPKAQ
jgi:hypothetical protein